MINRLMIACGLAVLVSATGLAVVQVQADHRDGPSLPRHFSGLLNDYGPSAAVVTGGPYEMRGTWSLDLDEQRGTANFSAALNMETSDYGIVQGTVLKDTPSTRGAHTHHIAVRDGVVTFDWATMCPSFSVPTTDGFVVTGPATITGNGGATTLSPSTATICVLGGTSVEFSNVTLTFAKPAANHFGLQAIHGVVTRCTDGGHRSHGCNLED